MSEKKEIVRKKEVVIGNEELIITKKTDLNEIIKNAKKIFIEDEGGEINSEIKQECDSPLWGWDTSALKTFEDSLEIEKEKMLSVENKKIIVKDILKSDIPVKPDWLKK